MEFTAPSFDVLNTPFEDIPNFDKYTGIALVYSATDATSLTKIMQWWDTFGKKSLPALLLATKSDEPEATRVLPLAVGAAVAEKYNMKVFEVSAKTESNVRLAIQSLIESIMLRKLVLRQPSFKVLYPLVSDGQSRSQSVSVACEYCAHLSTRRRELVRDYGHRIG